MHDHGKKPTAPDRKQPSGKQPRRVSAAYLERAALHYLERFAATTASLRRVLMRKVALSAHAHGTDPEEGRRWVDDLIARYERSGLLNDRQYAEAKVSSLQRRGGSTRQIRQKLAAKGVAGELIEGALNELAQDIDGDPDDAAALAYARRRRLGPFRPPEARAERRDRDLAALARAGFSLATARRVIDGGDGGGAWDGDGGWDEDQGQ